MNQIADQGKDPKTDRKEDLEAQPRAKPFEIYDTRLHGSRCACSLPVCAVLYLIFNEGYATNYKPPSRRFMTRPHRRSKPTGLRSMRFTDCWSEWATIRWSR